MTDNDIQAMMTLYRGGYTLERIGEVFGITRERVRQLLVRDMADYKDTKHRNFAAWVDRQKRQFTPAEVEYAQKLYDEGASQSEIAKALRASPAEVREVLWIERCIPVHKARRRFSDADFAAAFQRQSKDGIGPLPTAYEKNRIKGEEPSSQLAYVRFDGWSEACKNAGLQVPPTAGRGFRRSDYKTAAEILPDLVRFIEEMGVRRPTVYDYEDWQRGKAATSRTTVVRRFGSWRKAIDAALEAIDSRSEGGVTRPVTPVRAC
jgi:DNA-binding CsgD family transcriptional regulator